MGEIQIHFWNGNMKFISHQGELFAWNVITILLCKNGEKYEGLGWSNRETGFAHGC